MDKLLQILLSVNQKTTKINKRFSDNMFVSCQNVSRI